jgi:hypothetical protein
MALLQAARAHVLGLPLDSAYSWGLNRACYSEDTLVLTDNGWKLHSEVRNGERIMVFDPFTNTMWYEKPIALLSYQYEGLMIHFKTKLVDILVTPEHRMVYKSSSKSFNERSWKFAPAWELVGKRIIMPAIADWREERDCESVRVPEFLRKNGSIGPRLLEAVTVPIETWLEFAGYYLSEGGMDTKNHYALTLGQAKWKESYVDSIRKCLARLPFHSHEYVDEGMVRWNVGGMQLCEFLAREFGEGNLGKKIPSDMKNLPKRRLTTLLDAILLGDGTKRDGRFIRESTTSKQLAYDVEEIAVKIGISTNLRTQYEAHGNRSKCYQVTLRKAKYHDVGKGKITTSNYKGKLYCFSTSTGFYVTMRNGKVAFQGNTFYAAAKRGFKGGGGQGAGGHRSSPQGGGEGYRAPDTYHLGNEMAYKAPGSELLFTIGGKTQTMEDFQRQIESRFQGKFKDAWDEAVDYVEHFDRQTLLSGEEFFSSVYRPKRDELAAKWTEMSGPEEAPPKRGKAKAVRASLSRSRRTLPSGRKRSS